MAISPDALNTKMELAAAALEAGEFAQAERYLLSAKAILGSMPDGGQGTFNIRWDRKSIDDLLNQARIAQSGDLGIQSTKLKFVDVCE